MGCIGGCIGKFLFGLLMFAVFGSLIFMAMPDGGGALVIEALGFLILGIVIVIAVIVGLIKFIADLF